MENNNNRYVIRIKIKIGNDVETLYYSGSNDFSFMYEAFFSRDINMAQLWYEKPKDYIVGEFDRLTDNDSDAQRELHMCDILSKDILRVKRETTVLEEE